RLYALRAPAGMTALPNRRRSGLEPGAVGGAEVRADYVSNTRVIGVEPGQLLRRQQLRQHQPLVDGRQRQRLEAHHLAIAAGHLLRLGHQHEVLDADAVGAFLVVAGLVGDDHAGLQHGHAALGDALRALVHGEIAADAVAGAVVEVEPRLPQGAARERVEVDAARARREPDGCDG